MSGLKPPALAFTAHSAAPEDRRGTAEFTYCKWVDGDWIGMSLALEMVSFQEAHDLHNMMLQVWEGGDADGYARCESRVLESLTGYAK